MLKFLQLAYQFFNIFLTLPHSASLLPAPCFAPAQSPGILLGHYGSRLRAFNVHLLDRDPQISTILNFPVFFFQQ